MSSRPQLDGGADREVSANAGPTFTVLAIYLQMFKPYDRWSKFA